MGKDLSINQKYLRERLLWIGITVTLLTILVIVTFAPRALAQSWNQESKSGDMFGYVFEYILDHYVEENRLDSDALLEGALDGLFETLDDPYSAYLNEKEMRRMTDKTSGEFGGIGVYISETDRGIEVARPIEGTPAYEAGFLAGDLIIAVGSESMVGRTSDDAVNLIRGEPGTSVTITIKRGSSLTVDITLDRANIELPTVKSAMIPDGIGYLQISEFTPMTNQRVREALSYFEKEDFSSLIIDLRNNPGGLLSSVVDVADLFMQKDSVIVSTRSRFPERDRVYKAKKDPTVRANTPIVVLIDKYTVSAAEILTGALKDADRAYVIGEKTYGKGSVQLVVPLELGGFRLTTSRYYTPSEVTIEGVGIDPDLPVESESLSEEEMEQYRIMIEGDYIRNFVQKNPLPAGEDIGAFIQYMADEGITMPEKRIRRAVKTEVNRVNNLYPVYDLEFDTVLQKAVSYLD